jgi:2-polyprenyl-3-methyl-5-hydroxy-6-metoxy-1,4-benzoquinol methylase
MSDDDVSVPLDGEAIMAGMALRPTNVADFDYAYAGTPPWDIGHPQPVFFALAESGKLRGRILDIGCGTGEHALMAAGLGLDVVGIDMAATAIASAREKARERNLSAAFVVGDVCDIPTMSEIGPFDTVLDCGLFHILGDPERRHFSDALAAATAPGCRYFLLCFNEHVPGDWGPRRLTQYDIRSNFEPHWDVEYIVASHLEIIPAPGDVPAWLAALTRR